MSKIVRFIEDNLEDAELYIRLLKRGGDIEIEFVGVRPSMSDYADSLADSETGAFIVDERLSEYGGVDYTGLQLADFLRAIRPELPIYILTNYPKDIPESSGASVEFVVDKSSIRSTAQVVVSRILRHMQRYEIALSEQQKRLKDLIDLKLTKGLSTEEERVLEQLRAAIERPFGPHLIDEEQKWHDSLEKQEELLVELERLIGKGKKQGGIDL